MDGLDLFRLLFSVAHRAGQCGRLVRLTPVNRGPLPPGGDGRPGSHRLPGRR